MDPTNLPQLVQIEILSYFNFPERTILKLVCKKWKGFVESNAKNALCLYERFNPIGKTWPFTNKKIKYEETIRIIPNYIIWPKKCGKVNLNYFERIKKLTFYYLCGNNIFFYCANLNHFQQLEVLCIKSKEKISPFPVEIKLSSLNMLYVRGSQRIKLNAPNLKKFVYWNFNEKVFYKDHFFEEILHCVSYDWCNLDKLSYFKCQFFVFIEAKMENLEILICQKIKDGFNLKNYPKLKRLELYPTDLSIVEKINDQIRELNLFDLKFIVSGFENLNFCFNDKLIRNGCWDKRCYDLNKNQTMFLSKNYPSLTGKIPWPFVIDYSTLIECFKVIPIDFFNIFTRVYKVNVDGAVDEKSLLIFLKKSGLKFLSIKNNEGICKKEFYNQLPLIKSIRTLEIVDYNCRDFSFLLLLRNIEVIDLEGSKFTSYLMCQLFKSNKHFHTFRFKRFKHKKGLEIIDEKFDTFDYDIEIIPFEKSYYVLLLFHTNSRFKSENLDEIVSSAKNDDHFKKLIDI